MSSSYYESGSEQRQGDEAIVEAPVARPIVDNMPCGTGCGFSDPGNRAADARTRSASIRKLWTAVILCIVFMIVEVLGGIKANSLAILTDAAHLLTDVAGFAISLFAIWASGWEATPRQTYGFFRLEILGALVSIQLIWLLTGILIYEAIDRILHNTGAVDGRLMLIVSTLGLIVNIAMIFLLGHSDHGLEHSHSDRDSHDKGHWHGEGKGHRQQAKQRHAQEHRSNTEYSHDHGHKHEDLEICTASGQDKAELKKPLLSDVERAEHFVHSTNAGKTLGSGLKDAESSHLQKTKFKLDHDLDANTKVQKESHSHLNINVQGAYLHVLGDLVQSIGVMIGGVVIWVKPSWKIIDLICTLFFSVLVLGTTIKMLKSILEVFMESTPREIDATRLEEGLCAISGVLTVHELHIWAITVRKYLLACHVKIRSDANADMVLQRVIEYIEREYKISHITVQIEREV